MTGPVQNGLDPSRPEGAAWPSKGSPLFRTVLPKDLRALKQYVPITGTVIVESGLCAAIAPSLPHRRTHPSSARRFAGGRAPGPHGLVGLYNPARLDGTMRECSKLLGPSAHPLERGES